MVARGPNPLTYYVLFLSVSASRNLQRNVIRTLPAGMLDGLVSLLLMYATPPPFCCLGQRPDLSNWLSLSSPPLSLPSSRSCGASFLARSHFTCAGWCLPSSQHALHDVSLSISLCSLFQNLTFCLGKPGDMCDSHMRMLPSDISHNWIASAPLSFLASSISHIDLQARRFLSMYVTSQARARANCSYRSFCFVSFCYFCV